MVVCNDRRGLENHSEKWLDKNGICTHVNIYYNNCSPEALYFAFFRLLVIISFWPILLIFFAKSRSVV